MVTAMTTGYGAPIVSADRLGTLPMTAAPIPEPNNGHLAALLDAQRQAHRRDPYPNRHVRLDRLSRMRALVTDQGDAIIEAIAEDFGQRPAVETRMADLGGVAGAIDHAKTNLRSWMKPRRRRTEIWFRPANNAIVAQPKGVVGVMSPWNYPVDLALQPTVSALAAGNRVMVRMSEFTPITAALISELIADAFDPDEVTVVGGDASLAASFSHLRFDHLVFTGSTRVGRLVATAAAANLTPVTLELGGKSPAIISSSFPIETAATRITWGKTFNAGQTCIAPDYVLLHPEQRMSFIEAATRWFARTHGTSTRDYATIVNDAAFARAHRMVDDARDRGATVLETDLPVGHHARHFPLTFILDAPEDSLVMTEEIFAPVMPLVSSHSVSESIDFANDRDHPLAAYLFSDDVSEIEAASTRLVSGGLAINEVLVHFAQHDLPFGGVGASGIGRVHGKAGFDELSNLRGVFTQRDVVGRTGVSMLYPPYGGRTEKLLDQMGP